MMFTEIYSQILNDLRLLQKKADPEVQIYKKIFIEKGSSFLSQENVDESLYIFLYSVQNGGLFLQPRLESAYIDMYHAIKIRTLHRNASSAVVPKETIILKSGIIDSFLILDETYVRSVQYDRTMSICLLSEFLLLDKINVFLKI